MNFSPPPSNEEDSLNEEPESPGFNEAIESGNWERVAESAARLISDPMQSTNMPSTSMEV